MPASIYMFGLLFGLVSTKVPLPIFEKFALPVQPKPIPWVRVRPSETSMELPFAETKLIFLFSVMSCSQTLR